MRVYLGGGFRSGWQDRVKSAVTGFKWLDPRECKADRDPKSYTKRDIEWVHGCDVFFANLEESNPGGYDLAFELGVAFEMGKTIILVQDHKRKYWTMPRVVADKVFDRLDDAIQYLQGLQT